MTKKTIMEQLKEAREKVEPKSGFHNLDRLFSYVADEDGVPLDSSLNSVEGHVAVRTLDALERIANALESNANQTQIKGSLTYHEFFEEFNKISLGYHACSDLDEVVILDQGGNLKASLNSYVWSFRVSGFDSGELALMEKLAATPPELRGEIDNERNS